MSDTPKTDVQRFDTLTARGIRIAVPAKFAQDLERELAASHAREVVLREALQNIPCGECRNTGFTMILESESESGDEYYQEPCPFCCNRDNALTQPAPPVVSRSELDDLKRILSDPTAVHVNMLRGTIATPSQSQLFHVLGIEGVVPKAVADRLAEVLRHVTSVFSANSGRYYETMGEDNPRLTSLAQAIEKANATLAKYKEATP